MGKRIIARARGKGGPTYRSPSFNYKGTAKNKSLSKDNKDKTLKGEIVDIMKCRGHSAPLALYRYEDGEYNLNIAPEGIRVGDKVSCGKEAEFVLGSVMELMNIPLGSTVFNIENQPGDGGKFCRASGVGAKVVAKVDKGIMILLPSKKKKTMNGKCRASIGLPAGSGRTEKPILKAGNMYFKMKMKNKLWPRVSAGAMNAVDHPFGNKRSSRKSKAKVAPKNAPPGRNVGMIHARRTGRKKK